MKCLSCCLVLILSVTVSASDVEKPNIVFILADDLGWNALSCYGNEHVQTPHLDRLAADGMRFTDAYVLSQCLPTRAAFFSGQYGARTGLTSVETASPDYAPMISPGRPEGLPPEIGTLFEMLRDAGYATGMSGKWHIDKNYDGNRLYRQSGIESFQQFGIDYVGSSDTDDKGVDGITDDMLKFISDNKDRPFIAYLAHHSVHTPLAVPDEITQKYVERGYRRSSSKDGEFAERVVAEYLAMIDHLDASVGRVVDKIEELGIAEKTLVVFLSDNGGLTRVWENTPLRGGKGQLYEGGIRVPLIIKWPGQVKAGSECSVPVHVVDFFPTFIELSGGEVPDGQILDGVSIVGLLKGAHSLPRQAIFSHHPEYVVAFAKTPSSMIRKGDYKLIHYFGDYLDPTGCTPQVRTLSGRFILGQKTELFNLRLDPGELTDLSAEMPDKVKELMSELKSWWQETGAKFPRPNPHKDRSQWIWNDQQADAEPSKH